MKLVKEMEMANGGGAAHKRHLAAAGGSPVKDFGVERRKKKS